MTNSPQLSDRGSTVSEMPRGTPSPKISITMHPDVHARMVRAANADGLTVSAWITKAAEDRLAIDEGLALVGEWEAEHGAFTDEELAWADEQVAAQTKAARRWKWEAAPSTTPER